MRSVLVFVRRGAFIALLLAAVAGGATYSVVQRADDYYRATIVLIVSQPSSALATLGLVSPPPVDPGVFRTALLEGNIVRDALLRLTGQRPSDQDFEAFLRTLRVSIETRPVSSLIRLDVQHNDPSLAAELANTIAEELIIWDRERARRAVNQWAVSIGRAIAEIDAELAGDIESSRRDRLLALREQREQELEVAGSTDASAMVVGLLEPLRFASRPEHPAGPNATFLTLIAALLGLVAGYVLVLVMSALDNRVTDGDDAVADAGLPILAKFARRRRNALRLSGETASVLRTNLILASRGASRHVLLISSAVNVYEKDGVALALAESFSRAGHRTLLVDADLRHASTTAWLDVVPTHPAPFEAYLANPERRFVPITVSVGTRQSFDFVPSLAAVRFPIDLLHKGLAAVVGSWRQEYDVIVLDAPPIIPFADALAVSMVATGAVLCVSARTTTRDQLMEARDLLARSQMATHGVVVTALPPRRVMRHQLDDEMTALERQASTPYKTVFAPRKHSVDSTR